VVGAGISEVVRAGISEVVRAGILAAVAHGGWYLGGGDIVGVGVGGGEATGGVKWESTGGGSTIYVVGGGGSMGGGTVMDTRGGDGVAGDGSGTGTGGGDAQEEGPQQMYWHIWLQVLIKQDLTATETRAVTSVPPVLPQCAS
jgi:hypothetical protein